jgi:hypothetical protein
MNPGQLGICAGLHALILLRQPLALVQPDDLIAGVVDPRKIAVLAKLEVHIAHILSMSVMSSR